MAKKSSYWAVLPANVRYDDRVCANAKLLFTELTALTSQEGYCWATNDYFAELYHVSKRSISRWFSELEEAGYIRVEVVDGAKGFERKVWLVEEIVKPKKSPRQNCPDPLENNDLTPRQNCPDPLDRIVQTPRQKFPHNNNNDLNNELDNERERARAKAVPDSVELVIAYLRTLGCEAAETEGHKFFNHFKSNGWKVGGRAPMKDWRAAVRQWFSRIGEFGRGGLAPPVPVDFRKQQEEMERKKFLERTTQRTAHG